jgi:hypothetical protein
MKGVELARFERLSCNIAITLTENRIGFLVKSPVAVEKLLPTKSAKIKLRQEALQSIFSGCRDIFYPPNFGCLGVKASFSTATPVCDTC